jgi:hypothetical protein
VIDRTEANFEDWSAKLDHFYEVLHDWKTQAAQLVKARTYHSGCDYLVPSSLALLLSDVLVTIESMKKLAKLHFKLGITFKPASISTNSLESYFAEMRMHGRANNLNITAEEYKSRAGVHFACSSSKNYSRLLPSTHTSYDKIELCRLSYNQWIKLAALLSKETEAKKSILASTLSGAQFDWDRLHMPDDLRDQISVMAEKDNDRFALFFVAQLLKDKFGVTNLEVCANVVNYMAGAMISLVYRKLQLSIKSSPNVSLVEKTTIALKLLDCLAPLKAIRAPHRALFWFSMILVNRFFNLLPIASSQYNEITFQEIQQSLSLNIDLNVWWIDMLWHVAAGTSMFTSHSLLFSNSNVHIC